MGPFPTGSWGKVSKILSPGSKYHGWKFSNHRFYFVFFLWQAICFDLRYAQRTLLEFITDFISIEHVSGERSPEEERKKPMNTKYAWLSVLMSLALVLGVAGMSMAESFTNSGTYMFTESGNDSNFGIGNLEALIENWFTDNGYPQYDDIELEEYAKVDEPDTSNGGLTVTYGDDNKSGTWGTDEAVNFYSVKAGNSFAFYWENPATTSGTWATTDVFPVGNGNQPDVSHVSTWIMNFAGGPGPGPAPVPEPSTVFLMGLGLAGLGVTSYRKRNRK